MPGAVVEAPIAFLAHQRDWVAQVAGVLAVTEPELPLLAQLTLGVEVAVLVETETVLQEWAHLVLVDPV